MKTLCPYKALTTSNIVQAAYCIREGCSIWNEHLEMCSHKATSFLLLDIHQAIINFAVREKIISEQRGGENE